jgi:hypothetical protein
LWHWKNPRRAVYLIKLKILHLLINKEGDKNPFRVRSAV